MKRQCFALAGLLGLVPLAPSQAQDPWPDQRIPVLIVAGEGDHDWKWSSTTMRAFLEESGKFDVDITVVPQEDLGWWDLSRYGAFVLNFDGERWGDPAEERFLDAVRKGAGVVVTSGGCGAFAGWKDYEELVGFAPGEGAGESGFHAFDVKVVNRDHPLSAGLDGLQAHADVLHHGLANLHETDHVVLATAFSDPAWGGSGRDEPVLFAGAFEKGRVANLPLGHVGWGDRRSWSSLNDPQMQRLLIRSVEWTATGGVTPLRKVEPNTLTPADRAAGWQLLFDGTSVNGWKSGESRGFPEDRWQVEGGALKILPGEGGDILSEERFENFELELEWRVAANSDAELFYGFGPGGELMWKSALEAREEQGAEGGEPTAPPPGMEAAEGRILRPAGEFNHARVVASTDRIEHWLNGVHFLTLQMTPAEWAASVRGESIAEAPELQQLPGVHIALSGKGHDVWVRNIKIRRIPDPEPAPVAGPETVVLFNGKDLEGWVRHSWSPNANQDGFFFADQEGNLVSEGRPVGYLRTEGRYENYVLELEWRYRAHANDAGVLIGIGEHDDVWPRALEVQMLRNETGNLWTHGGLTVDRVQGRTAGQVTRRLRDAEKPNRAWNRFEIRVENGVVTVLLNDVLVNQVTGFSEEPGAIGLKSEGGQMLYRNIRLTPIE